MYESGIPLKNFIDIIRKWKINWNPFSEPILGYMQTILFSIGCHETRRQRNATYTYLGDNGNPKQMIYLLYDKLLGMMFIKADRDHVIHENEHYKYMKRCRH